MHYWCIDTIGKTKAGGNLICLFNTVTAWRFTFCWRKRLTVLEESIHVVKWKCDWVTLASSNSLYVEKISCLNKFFELVSNISSSFSHISKFGIICVKEYLCLITWRIWKHQALFHIKLRGNIVLSPFMSNLNNRCYEMCSLKLLA